MTPSWRKPAGIFAILALIAVWAIVVATILLSSTIHGLTASFVMRRLSKSGEGMV